MDGVAGTYDWHVMLIDIRSNPGPAGVWPMASVSASGKFDTPGLSGADCQSRVEIP